MTIRSLVVDDMLLARKRLVRYLEAEPDVEVIGECSGGQEAIDAIRQLSPDLLFLDVQMPEIGGFEVIEAVGPGACPVVVFVTAYDQFALKAFEVHALDYLLKPFDEDRLVRTLARARRLLRQGRDEGDARIEKLVNALGRSRRRFGRLAVKVDGRMVFLGADEIDFVEAAGNYVRIQARTESYLVRERISQVETMLDADQFVRIHRSTIVNVSRIREMQPLFNGDQAIVLRDGRQLTLSRTFRERLLAVLNQP